MFIEANIETILAKLASLESTTKPLWGAMSAQRMVEHLTDAVRMSNGKESFELEIPADRIEKMQLFLASDKPMAKNIEVAFAGKDVPLRHSEIELAIDELTEEWCDFEEVYDENPELTNIHPYYGQLNFDQWKRIHAKHFTHHFEQFGLM